MQTFVWSRVTQANVLSEYERMRASYFHIQMNSLRTRTPAVAIFLLPNVTLFLQCYFVELLPAKATMNKQSGRIFPFKQYVLNIIFSNSRKQINYLVA